jgi:hypothetical protein
MPVICDSLHSWCRLGRLATFIATSTIACVIVAHAQTPEATLAQSTGSETSASCSFTIPYSRVPATPASDHVGLSYAISAATPGAPPLVLRYSTRGIATIAVPASGTNTTESVAATI